MIIVKTEVNALEHIVLDQGHYIIPRKDGQLLIGSTMEDAGFDRSTDKQVGDELALVNYLNPKITALLKRL
jgi:glycine oxidase